MIIYCVIIPLASDNHRCRPQIGKILPIENVYELHRQGKLYEASPRAPLKDTVIVHDGGYTIVRFRATNPGIWFFHCHLEFHVELGMGLVLQVSEKP